MRIAVLEARIGSAAGRLWHAAGHDVTFAARDPASPHALSEELGERAHAATVPGAVTAAEAVLVAVPGPAVTDVLTAAGGLGGLRAASGTPQRLRQEAQGCRLHSGEDATVTNVRERVEEATRAGQQQGTLGARTFLASTTGNSLTGRLIQPVAQSRMESRSAGLERRHGVRELPCWTILGPGCGG